MGQPQEDERRLESGLIASDGKLRCARCSRSFKRPEHLKRHERSHEGLRSFSCSVCDKKFARRYAACTDMSCSIVSTVG